MKWIKVSVKANHEIQEIVSDVLMELGTSGVEIYDPIEIEQQIENSIYGEVIDKDITNNLPDYVIVSAYYSNDLKIDDLKSSIFNMLKDKINKENDSLIEVNIDVVDDSKWKDNWKKYYKTFEILDNIIIKPSWEEYIKTNNEIVLEIDPGNAFGTGTHESTALCAKLLKQYAKSNMKMLDIGCGTGILSMIAYSLDVTDITAIDIDMAAIKAAEENYRINNIKNVKLISGELNQVPEEKYDIIVANIIADVVIGFSSDVKKYLSTNSVIILSGIIIERKDDVINNYKKHGFTIENIENKGEWVAIALSA